MIKLVERKAVIFLQNIFTMKKNFETAKKNNNVHEANGKSLEGSTK